MYIVAKHPELKGFIPLFKMSWNIYWELIKFGIPLGFNGQFFYWFFFQNSQVNLFGDNAQQAMACYSNYEGYVTMPFSALSTAVTTYVGQNYGAKKYRMINLGINNVDDNGEDGLICSYNVITLLEETHRCFPDANIYYFSITRCTGTFASKWTNHSLSNQRVSSFIATRSYLTYLDVMSIYDDDYASYLYDGLHPNSNGYQVFLDLINEYVALDNKSDE